MEITATRERTLSKNESRIVLDLEWRGQKNITLDDLRTLLDSSDAYARYVAHRLVQKGWLERLRPGLFRLIPAARGREAIADMNPLTVGAVLADPYFYSFGTACTYHGLTEQAFAEVYIACRLRRSPETIRGIRYVFVQVRESRFFGFEETNALGDLVQMATRERALLDALDRPRYAGGIGEVSRMVARAAPKVSWEALMDLLQRWGESALVQRLGYLLEFHKVEPPPRVHAALQRLMRPGSKVLLGSRRQWGTSGPLASPWNVVVNVPMRVLVETGDASRRRVTLGKRRSSP